MTRPFPAAGRPPGTVRPAHAGWCSWNCGQEALENRDSIRQTVFFMAPNSRAGATGAQSVSPWRS